MNYDFSSLSSSDFEDLARDLVGRETGLRFEAFSAGPDGGMDGRHACAFGVLTEAQAMGIGVPSQLAVIGFGDFEVSRCCLPALTTTAVDGARIGRETGTLLLNLLGYAEADEGNDISDGKTSHRIRIEVHLTPRGTTRGD